MDQPNRRDVLRTGWKLGGALLIGAAGYTGYEALRPLATGATGGKITLLDKGNYAEGTATYIPAGRLYIATTHGQTFALSQKCPHLGCRVPFCESSGRFECPCHGSIYDLAGEYIAGPAPRGMDQYAVEVDANNHLVVDTSKSITGPDHGAQKYLTPAKGPGCLGKT